MCRRHWKTLPPAIRDAIEAAYRPGQPSHDYLIAARIARDWACNHELKLRGRM